MRTSSRLQILTGLVLAALVVGGTGAASPATASPDQGALVRDQKPKIDKKHVDQAVKWFTEQVVQGLVQYVITEGISRITVADSPTAEQAVADFFAKIPTVTPSSVSGDPARLVTFAAQSPTIDGVEHISYVRAKPRELFTAVCAGSRVNQNECKSGVTSVVFSPGSKTDKPYIKVSNTATTTKVIVLAN